MIKRQNRYAYDAWGSVTEQTEAVPNRFEYTGQQLDLISQKYYLRARFYNPVIARFTQEDTYCGGGLNLYHVLLAGTVLPLGSGIISDGSDVLSDSPHGPGYHTVFPTQEMSVGDFNNLF